MKKKNISKGWDELFEDNKNRWQTPNPYVLQFTKELKKRFKKPIRVLDVGYGTGRHIIFLHNHGFQISGFDIASNASEYTKKIFANMGGIQNIELKNFDMNMTPWSYETASFEGVVSINTIHHTNYEGFIKIVKEIARIMISGGLAVITIASKNNHKYGRGKKLDEYSYATDFGEEKGIPHAFFDKSDLEDIFLNNFNFLEFKLVAGEIPEKDKKLKKKGALDHWMLLIEKK